MNEFHGLTDVAYESKKKEKRMKYLGIIWKVLFCVFAAASITPQGQDFWRQAACLSGFSDLADRERPLEIHVIDVGKADAILIKSDGQAALLDAGHFLAGEVVEDYLRRHGVEALDYVIMSHPDSDHMGGIAGVVSAMEAKTFLCAQVPESASSEMADLEAVLKKRSVSTRVLRPGEGFALGQAVFTALGPIKDYEESNNASLVLRLDCAGFSALFCGDIEKKAEEDLVESGQDLSVDLLKVAHHGSATSCGEAFISQVAPRYAVISTGLDRNKLPREQPLVTLENAGAVIYRTDTDGDIVFTFDGEYGTVTTEK